MSCAKPDSGTERPISVIACLKRSRFSAVRIASILAPMSSTPYRLEHAGLGELNREVERRLAAHRRQQGVGPLPLDDGGEHVGLERLDVGAVGKVGVGHDRGRVRVRQDDPVSLLAEHSARLCARVVELASLADHDRTRADHEDRRQVVAAAHQLAAMRARNSSNRYLAS